jgi:hypothetical protein
MQPHMLLCDMLPQCPSWMDALAPSAWIASVNFFSSGTISSRIQSWFSKESPLLQTAAYATVVIPMPPRATAVW